MIRWPWKRWIVEPLPPDLDDATASQDAVVEAHRRSLSTRRALQTRRAVVVNNHIATDIRRAMGARG